MSGPAILVTRPEPGAAETAARVAALGWTPVLAPALVLTPCDTTAPDGAQALLLPSAAAIPAAKAAAPPGLPTLAVGEATATTARRAGLAALGAAGDAAALAALAAERLDPRAGPLWMAVGEGYGADLEALLRARGFDVVRRAAYRVAPAPTLPEAAHAAVASGAVVAALFFSPRSAECAINLLRSAGLLARVSDMTALALSARVAEAAEAALAPASWAAMRVAASPDQDSLLDRLNGMGPAKDPPPGMAQGTR